MFDSVSLNEISDSKTIKLDSLVSNKKFLNFKFGYLDLKTLY
jgi:hypothetical protein